MISCIIKPQNILVLKQKDDMILNITDFGLLKVTETAFKTHTRVGHDLYMHGARSKNALTIWLSFSTSTAPWI